MSAPRKPPARSTPKSVSPAERAEEFATHQQELKQEAAERRVRASEQPEGPRRPRPTGSARSSR